MNVACRALLLTALVAVAQPGRGQSLHYVEAGNAACPVVPAAAIASPKAVSRGVALPGRLHVACGFGQGSYTVTLNSTDPDAVFAPKTFVVNFGRLVGENAFTVTFSKVGVQSVSATITSNMGSPAVAGRFVSPNSEYEVVSR